jgi:hypothetical protein
MTRPTTKTRRTTLPRETWVERNGVTGCILGVFALDAREDQTEYRVETAHGQVFWKRGEFTVLPTDESSLVEGE